MSRIFVFSLIALAACTGSTKGPDKEQPFFPSDFAQTYRLVRDCRQSNAHDMHFISVMASPGEANAYREKLYPLPKMTVLVKTLHDDPRCTTPIGYVAMRKEDDWIWQETTATFKIRTSGLIESCITCHSRCSNRDFTCTDP